MRRGNFPVGGSFRKTELFSRLQISDTVARHRNENNGSCHRRRRRHARGSKGPVSQRWPALTLRYLPVSPIMIYLNRYAYDISAIREADETREQSSTAPWDTPGNRTPFLWPSLISSAPAWRHAGASAGLGSPRGPFDFPITPSPSSRHVVDRWLVDVGSWELAWEAWEPSEDAATHSCSIFNFAWGQCSR